MKYLRKKREKYLQYILEPEKLKWKEGGIMSRGGAFISDAAISSLCILLMLMATMHIIAENWRREALSGHESEKELFALAVSESIVKNRSETDPAKGAAYFDFAKKRVEVNVLDETLLNKIEPRETGKYYFAGVYEKSRGMGTVQT